MPLVAAQVTKFDCGGYSIGIGISHSVFDGISAFDFLRAWASQCQAPISTSQIYKPVHERGTLLVDKDSSTATNSVNPTAIDHLYQLIRQAAPDHPNQETNTLVLRTFHLSSAMIENLRKKFWGEKRDKFSCSSFELLAAHLWKVRTKVLGVERERKVCLQFAVDTRKRMVPPLPKGFSGNAFVLASLVSTAGELEERSYEYIIDQIKEAKNSINHHYVDAYIKALRGPPQVATLPPLPELTLISDWTRAPFHRVDFLGEAAAYASPLLPPIPQVAYFMQNPDDCRAMDVRIGLLPRVQAAFSHQFINII
ncbi:UNVERIFIED_CONTAM: Brassinosteroid-related acyltransferase 1 [Sesamum radiatum]|uniref:Brassinosteroid-related acyltransferase 1 n=1 Tax=Sesamum radiatum TaxID=300843 RepID=A0AAW2TVX3_SESRA